jgi:tRNA (guanine37-N1)-methyltransferase
MLLCDDDSFTQHCFTFSYVCTKAHDFKRSLKLPIFPLAKIPQYLPSITNFEKVRQFVRPFCEDGHVFIQHAVDDLLNLTATHQNTISIPKKLSRNARPSDPASEPTIITIPQTISHFVMNLPATAIDFLGSFNGLYHGHESLFEPHTEVKLPMVHVHCFSTKSDDNVREGIEICERISEKLGYVVKPGDEELVIHEVRDVAPKKRMFCASFRLPGEVAFRKRIAR